MGQTLPSFLLRFSVAFLKHQGETIFGEDALKLLANAAADFAGETLNEKLESFLSEKGTLQKIRAAFERADQHFASLKPEYRDLQLRLTELPSLEEIAAQIPAHLDDPNALLNALESTLVEYFPHHLPADFLRQAARDYRDCLEASLASLFQESLLPLIFARLTRVMQTVQDIHSVLCGKHHYLPTFETAIQNFLTLYLGKPGEPPVPFGGRDEDLAHLTRWLFSEKAPPYFLLTGPAGRGKSALLVRWVAALASTLPKDWQVIFLPISIRAETNLETVFFKALAVRLSEALDDDLKTKVEGQTPSEVWRDLCASYLSRPMPQGKRLLIVVDGLDEAAGWSLGINLIPLQPPAGLKLLVSARLTARHKTRQDWLRELGWDEFPSLRKVHELPCISEAGVADILRNMGMPLDRLAEREEIIRTLHHLSEGGDPLLLNLYTQDLWKQGDQALRLSVEELKALKPGYEGYFEKWWADQEKLWGEDRLNREEATRFLFDALAFAFGPLRMDDLLDLAERKGKSFERRHLEQALTSMDRFVFIREEEKNTGYVFNHPKLSEYFYTQIQQASQREAHRWEETFLQWGESTLERLERGEISPADAPAYLLQYYTAHLNRTNAPLEKYLRLTHSPVWMQAWERLEGSYDGFMNDLMKVWSRVEKEHQSRLENEGPLPWLGEEIRCACLQASVRSLSGNLPAELLAALVHTGVWSPARALAHIRNMPDPSARASALSALAPLLPPDLLPQALTAAQSIQDPFFRASALRDLAPLLPPDLLPQALTAAQSIENPSARASALRDLAPLLANLSPQTLYPLWRNLLHHLALRRRKDLLSDFQSLLPVMERLGGKPALEAAARAIIDVGAWLP